jgi:threonine dehydratase
MVSLESFRQAQQRLRGVAARTPLIQYFPPGQPGAKAHDRILRIKPESLQPIGSFKLRGAYNKIATLSDAERQRGVITYSSGNHAQGVAYGARAMGVKATIVMPRNAPKVKMDATKALGAEVVMVGLASSERRKKAEELAREHGYAIVPPYDDEQIVSGQATVGLEIFEDLPEADVVLVPIGGGGLISGVSAALKMSGSKAKIIGVEPELANDAQQSLRAGKIVTLSAERVSSTLADGLRTQSVGDLNFDIIRQYVDDIVTVEEDEIREAMRRMMSETRLVVEPSGAVTFAAYLFHEQKLPRGRNVVAVMSGGNIEPSLLAEVMTESDAVSAMKVG